MSRYYQVIIPCGGAGSRFGAETPKQYQPLLGQTVLDWTLQPFRECSLIEQIMVVVSPHDRWIDNYTHKYPNLKIAKVAGATRAQTVLNGLNELNFAPKDWILVHDAARCCLRSGDLARLIAELKNSPVGGILAKKATDTIKQVNSVDEITATIDRNHIYQAQTPQMFRGELLLSALHHGGENITDEASAVERLGYFPRIVECGEHNLKVTYPEDLLIAEIYLRQGNNV